MFFCEKHCHFSGVYAIITFSRRWQLRGRLCVICRIGFFVCSGLEIKNEILCVCYNYIQPPVAIERAAVRNL